MPEVGDTFERYVVEELLGQGGMGQVFRAYNPLLRRRVALKVLVGDDRQRRSRSGPDPAERLLREARAAAGLRHPNIVAVFDVGERDGEPYIVMEFVEGETLRAHVAAGTTSLGQKLRFIFEMADALSCAHEHGVIHRDVKPENVIVRKDGTAQVLDFGVAKLEDSPFDSRAPTVDEPPSVCTIDGHVVGTPRYMSPEQLAADEIRRPQRPVLVGRHRVRAPRRRLAVDDGVESDDDCACDPRRGPQARPRGVRGGAGRRAGDPLQGSGQGAGAQVRVDAGDHRGPAALRGDRPRRELAHGPGTDCDLVRADPAGLAAGGGEGGRDPGCGRHHDRLVHLGQRADGRAPAASGPRAPARVACLGCGSGGRRRDRGRLAVPPRTRAGRVAGSSRRSGCVVCERSRALSARSRARAGQRRRGVRGTQPERRGQRMEARHAARPGVRARAPAPDGGPSGVRAGPGRRARPRRGHGAPRSTHRGRERAPRRVRRLVHGDPQHRGRRRRAARRGRALSRRPRHRRLLRAPREGGRPVRRGARGVRARDRATPRLSARVRRPGGPRAFGRGATPDRDRVPRRHAARQLLRADPGPRAGDRHRLRRVRARRAGARGREPSGRIVARGVRERPLSQRSACRGHSRVDRRDDGAGARVAEGAPPRADHGRRPHRGLAGPRSVAREE